MTYGTIKSNHKNRRNCEKCGAGYVINGDESKYWCEFPWFDENGIAFIPEGLCEFCTPKFLSVCHSLVPNECNCGKPSSIKIKIPGSIRILCSQCEIVERENISQLNAAWAKHFSKCGKSP